MVFATGCETRGGREGRWFCALASFSKNSLMKEETKKPYQNIILKRTKDSIVEIKGEITAETLEAHRKNVFAEVKKDFEMPGFRKGHVPDEKVMKHIDEKHLLEEAADSALNHVYPVIVEDYHIEPVAPPEVTVTKLAFGLPLAFTLRVGVTPEVKLPDYKSIAKAIMKEKRVEAVEEKDVDEVIRQIREMRSAHAAHAGKENSKEQEGTQLGELPPLNDALVKTLGDFRDVADFRAKLKENLKKEKEQEATRVIREALAKALEEKTAITVPEPLVEREVNAIRDRLEDSIVKNGLDKEEYFKKIGKREEEFFKEQRDYIIRQFKTKFILHEIAKQEHLHPDSEEITLTAQELMVRYSAAHPPHLYRYAEEMLLNEKVLRFLEEIGGE